MTFYELAEEILKDADQPLTANEIWQLAIAKQLDEQLNSQGQTPWATLGAIIYVAARDNPQSNFGTLGKRPKRFYLKNKDYQVDLKEYAEGKTEEEVAVSPQPKATPKYAEKDLHPFLAHFARYSLGCYTKTIRHSKSNKKTFGEWVHPDMVGCVFPIDEWDEEVLELSSAIGNTSIQLISFELKKEVNLSTLREKFFQTVSNSSWANESYLVAAEVSQNQDFLDELERLSSSFGIGVIQLELKDPHASRVVFPAKVRENLDWDTVNKLTGMNEDFKLFVKRVRKDLQSNEIRKEQYDLVWEAEKLVKSIK